LVAQSSDRVAEELALEALTEAPEALVEALVADTLAAAAVAKELPE
jgi:hypothetical protein